jgi:hypothetical protein
VKRAILRMTLALAIVAPVMAPVGALGQPALAARGQQIAAQIAAGQAVAGQEVAGAAYYASLLQLYGVQSAAAAAPSARTAMAQAMSDYYTNGARATGVPTSGPAASYFTNGAEMSTIPTSMSPDYSFSPAFPETASTTTPVPEAGAPIAPFDASPPTPLPPAPPAPADGGALALVTPVTPAPPPTDTIERPAPPLGRAPLTSQAPVSSPASETAPATTADSTPAPEAAPVTESAPEPEMTRASTILLPMAAGVGFAGLLIAIGLSIHPHVRRLRRR